MAVETPVCDFGWPAPAFQLLGTNGRTWTLEDVRGPCGTLVMFLCNHCPYVQAVISRLVTDVEALRPHGIGAVAIMPNDIVAYPADGLEAMKVFAETHRLPFRYLLDQTQATARAYGAVCTPDFFGFDAGLRLQYRGRLDAGGRASTFDGPRELRDAMIEIAATGRGPERQTASIGCSVKWREE